LTSRIKSQNLLDFIHRLLAKKMVYCSSGEKTSPNEKYLQPGLMALKWCTIRKFREKAPGTDSYFPVGQFGPESPSNGLTASLTMTLQTPGVCSAGKTMLQVHHW
jgi:hypothetical protein